MSEFFNIHNNFFVVAGQGISYLEFLAVLFGLSSVFLASMAKSLTFWLSIVYAILLFMMYVQKNLYTNMLLQPVLLGLCVYGLIKWTRPKEGQGNASNQLKITFLTNKQRVTYVVVMAAFIVGWGFFLTKLPAISDVFPPARSPFIDASVAGLLLLSQTLSAQKKWECWVVFIVLNILNVVMYAGAGLVFMPIVAVIYLVFNVIGIVHWRKEWRKQEAESGD